MIMDGTDFGMAHIIAEWIRSYKEPLSAEILVTESAAHPYVPKLPNGQKGKEVGKG